MHEQYGISQRTALEFATILEVIYGFRQDYDCGPSLEFIAPFIERTTAIVDDRLVEMEGMGFVRSARIDNRRVEGSLNTTRLGDTYRKQWERANGPVAVTFS